MRTECWGLLADHWLSSSPRRTTPVREGTECKNSDMKMVNEWSATFPSDRESETVISNFAVRNILTLPTTFKFSSKPTSQHPSGRSYSFYNITLNIFDVLVTNLIKSSNPIFNVYYISHYLHLDVRRDLDHTISGIAICISYYEYVVSLKMAFRGCIMLLMISLLYQLDTQILYFNTFIMLLYMFRALLCSSSWGQLYYYSISYRHSL